MWGGVTMISTENIPTAMRELNHWVLWKKQFENGRWAKIPYQISGKRAESDNPSTWTSFSNVLKCRDPLDGIGFMFSGSEITGIDLDHCVSNGQYTPQAKEIVNLLKSYTELSPSGTGIHVYVFGTVPSGVKTSEIEMSCPEGGIEFGFFDGHIICFSSKLLFVMWFYKLKVTFQR